MTKFADFMFRRLKAEGGAQTLEFALVAPVLLLMVLGCIYALLVVTAHVTLAHAASAAVRFASIPTDNIEPGYPTQDEVSERLFTSTPFFSRDGCTVALAGDRVPNAPVSLNVSCPFANPLGSVLSGLQAMFSNSREQPYPDMFTVSATATGRRE